MANKDKKSLSSKASPGRKADAKFDLPPDYRHPSFYPNGKAEPLFNVGERGKIACDLIARLGALHFDGDFTAIAQGRAVHLAERRRGDRRAREG